ncbi:MAG TPA: response regulator [Clostridia bacterium]|nr:response regulator [Clostridia bacterium]
MGDKGLSVLLVDDSLLVRKQLRGMLEEMNCTVLEAANGVQAVDIVAKDKPDLVLMDIVMPETDGIETLKKIKEINQAVKIVMVSSVGTQSYLKEAIKSGAFDFLQKPVDKEALQRLVGKLQKAGSEA